jgi:NADH-quinone oxidoreductase E subunit
MIEQKTVSHQTLNKIIDKCGRTEEAAIPILQKVQEELGYVPLEAMEYIAENTDITGTQIYGVATFFKQFRLKPVGKNIIKVCHGTACHVKGANKITQAISEELNIETGETSSDKLFTLESVACLGCCSLAPVIMINEAVYGNLTPDSTKKIIKEYQSGAKK